MWCEKKAGMFKVKTEEQESVKEIRKMRAEEQKGLGSGEWGEMPAETRRGDIFRRRLRIATGEGLAFLTK